MALFTETLRPSVPGLFTSTNWHIRPCYPSDRGQQVVNGSRKYYFSLPSASACLEYAFLNEAVEEPDRKTDLAIYLFKHDVIDN